MTFSQDPKKKDIHRKVKNVDFGQFLVSLVHSFQWIITKFGVVMPGSCGSLTGGSILTQSVSAQNVTNGKKVAIYELILLAASQVCTLI